MLWLAVVRGIGIRGAIPLLVLLAVARRLARSRRAGKGQAPQVQAEAVEERGSMR